MIIYKAKLLFSCVRLCNKDTDAYVYTLYSCPKCKSKLCFSEKDFHRNESNKTTKFRDIFSNSLVGNYNSFLEFECLECKIKTRVNFGIFYGDKFPIVNIDSVMTE